MNGSEFLHFLIRRLVQLLGDDSLLKEYQELRENFVRQEFRHGVRGMNIDEEVDIQKAWDQTLQLLPGKPQPRRKIKIQTAKTAAEAIFRKTLENPFYDPKLKRPFSGQDIYRWQLKHVKDEFWYKRVLNDLIDAFLMQLMLNCGLRLDFYANFAQLTQTSGLRKRQAKTERDDRRTDELLGKTRLVAPSLPTFDETCRFNQ